MSKRTIPLRDFGATGIAATQVGLGGEGILRTFNRQTEARQVLLEALEEGITYFDSARVYAGSEGYYGELWGERPHERSRVFQATKSASRDKQGALADLEMSLKRLNVSHVDLWQIHDVRTRQDIEAIEGPSGALEAFLEAKSSGRVKFIGVTGHHDPSILQEAVNRWPVDAVMLPVNPVEGVLGGFVDSVIETAAQKGIAIIAMKTLGAGHYVSPEAGVTAELLFRYALSFPVSVVIAGCATPHEASQLARAGRLEEPLSPKKKAQLESLFRPHAHRLAFYRAYS
jgi:aryl-alcohol dehydrogenase-like predicted oxidoreductase